MNYDFLIVAAGARHSYFGHPEWEAIAPGLKASEDAIDVATALALAFERAERLTDAGASADEIRANLTFVDRRRRANGRRARRHAADHRALRAAARTFGTSMRRPRESS